MRCCATAIVTPGFSRATMSQLLLCRPSSVACSGLQVKGVHSRASRPGWANAFRHDSDHAVVHAAQSQVFSHHAGVAPEHVFPKPVAQNDELALLKHRVVFGEQPPHHGRRAQHAEVGRRDLVRLQPHRRSLRPGVIPRVGVLGHALEYVRHLPPVQVIRNRVLGVLDHADARVDVAHGDQPVRFGERQRRQNHRVQHRENRRVGADAQCQRQQAP